MSVDFLNDNLGYLRKDLKKGFELLLKVVEENPDCEALQGFYQRRKKDYHLFQDMCLKYVPDNYIRNISEDLKKRNKACRFYGGMCHRGGEYFKIPKKIQEDIYQNQIEFDNSKKVLIDSEYGIFDELTGEDAEVFATQYFKKYDR